jgi:hypothetical protein
MAMQWTLGELLVSTREFVSTPLVPFYKLLKYTDLVDDRYYHPALMLHTMDIPVRGCCGCTAWYLINRETL